MKTPSSMVAVPFVLACAVAACGGRTDERVVSEPESPSLRLARQMAQGEPSDRADDDAGDDERGRTVLRYPGALPSLQATIDAAPDGAVVRVAGGVYTEPVRIVGKRLTLLGAGSSGPGASTLAGAPLDDLRPAPMVSLGLGADVAMRGFAVSTSGDAFATDPPGQSGGAANAALAVADVVVSNANRAVAGTFARVALDRVSIARTLGDAVDLGATAESVFRQVTVGSAGGRAFVIRNGVPQSGPCIVRFAGVTIDGARDGGIAVLGHACPVYITNTTVENAAGFGIGLFDVAFARLGFVTVRGTTPLGGSFGDGIFLWAAGDVSVEDSLIENNARAGVTAIGCTGTGQVTNLALLTSRLDCNAFDLDVEPYDYATGGTCAGFGTLLDGGGSDTCQSCDGTAHACAAQSSHLTAIPAPHP